MTGGLLFHELLLFQYVCYSLSKIWIIQRLISKLYLKVKNYLDKYLLIGFNYISVDFSQAKFFGFAVSKINTRNWELQYC